MEAPLGCWRRVLSVMVVTAAASLADGPASVPGFKEVQREAAAAWREILDADRSLTGTILQDYSVTVTDPSNDEHGKVLKRTERRDFDRFGGNLRVVENDPNPLLPRQTVTVVSEDFAFRVRKHLAHAPFQVTTAAESGSDFDRLEFVARLLVVGDIEAFRHVDADPRPLDEIWDAPGFVLLKIERSADSRLLAVHCTYPPTGLAAEQDPSWRRTTVWLDPGNHWVVVRSESTRGGESKVSSSMHVAYESGVEPPLVKSVHSREINPHSTIESISRLSTRRAEFDHNVFTLEHYGLPDLRRTRLAAESRARWLSTLAWASAIGAGLVAAAFWMRRRRGNEPFARK